MTERKAARALRLIPGAGGETAARIHRHGRVISRLGGERRERAINETAILFFNYKKNWQQF